MRLRKKGDREPGVSTPKSRVRGTAKIIHEGQLFATERPQSILTYKAALIAFLKTLKQRGSQTPNLSLRFERRPVTKKLGVVVGRSDLRLHQPRSESSGVGSPQDLRHKCRINRAQDKDKKGERMDEMTQRQFLKTIGNILTVALVLTFGAVGIQAQELPVRMTFSGTLVATGFDLQPGGAPAFELTAAGRGSLGPLTLHDVNAGSGMPSGTCGGPNFLAFTQGVAAGVFRFQDGSLLTYKLKEGTLCLDVTKNIGKFTGTQQITGGTGRFNNAAGTLLFTFTGSLVLADSMMSPVLIAISDGEATGTIILSNTQ